jgi:hypothetical protein
MESSTFPRVVFQMAATLAVAATASKRLLLPGELVACLFFPRVDDPNGWMDLPPALPPRPSPLECLSFGQS